MIGIRRTKPRTMRLSQFSSLSRRSNRLAFGASRESFAQAALIRLRRLDRAAHVCGLGIMAPHVVVDLFLMGQAVGEHCIYVGEP